MEKRLRAKQIESRADSSQFVCLLDHRHSLLIDLPGLMALRIALWFLIGSLLFRLLLDWNSWGLGVRGLIGLIEIELLGLEWRLIVGCRLLAKKWFVVLWLCLGVLDIFVFVLVLFLFYWLLGGRYEFFDLNFLMWIKVFHLKVCFLLNLV